jgi:periplasmic divalent cation tolerance protein
MIIEKKLAACVQIIPGVKSIYKWQNKIEVTAEHILQFKTTVVLAKRLMAAIKEVHHYEVPELIAVNTDLIDTHYYKWLKDVTEKDIPI